MSLKAKAFQGVTWNSLASLITLLLSFVQLYILVRYLDTSDFGNMALGLMVISYFATILDLGTNAAVIHKDSINKETRSSLYTLVLLNSIFLFIILNLSANFIAEYFDAEKLADVISLLSISIIFDATGNLFFVFLHKELEFKKIGLANMTGSIIMMITSVLLAIQGFGVLSLVYAFLITSLYKNVFYIFATEQKNFINLRLQFNGLKEYLKFGIYDLGNKSFQNFTQRLDTLFIGKILGTDTLGIYDVFKNLLMKPQSLIAPVFTNVSYPLISKVKNDTNKIREIYLTQMEIIFTIISPIYLFLMCYASEIIHLYLGNNFLEHTEVFLLLSIYFLVRISGVPVGGLLLALGKVKHLFWWNLVLAFITMLSLYLFIKTSLTSAIIVLLVLQLTFVIPNYIINVSKHIRSTTTKYFSSFIMPIVLACISFGITLTMKQFFQNEILLISSSLIVGTSIYVLLLYLFRNEFFTTLSSYLNISKDKH